VGIGVVIGSERGADAVLDQAVTLARPFCQPILVVALQEPPHSAAAMASIVGIVSPPELYDAVMQGAAELARRVSMRVPADVDARHLVCPGWRSKEMLTLLRSGQLDLVLVGCRLPRPWARRAVLSAARAGSVTITRVARRSTPAEREITPVRV
jgi:hypothetical protein